MHAIIQSKYEAQVYTRGMSSVRVLVSQWHSTNPVLMMGPATDSTPCLAVTDCDNIVYAVA